MASKQPPQQPTGASQSGKLDFGPEVAPVKIDIGELIVRLLSATKPNQGITKTISAAEITYLLHQTKAVFMSQSACIEIDPPVRICGDTHGQYADVLRLFHRGGFPPTSNYLFLGDYIDRGRQNLETILLLFAYKVRYPKSFFLLRGNHECPHINKVYGFFEECSRRYTPRVWQSFQDTFAFMPLTGIVGERILCMHGGLSPKLESLDQLRKIARPSDPQSDCLEMDLLWADPVHGVEGFEPNVRGASYSFGQGALKKFCSDNGIDLVARAHQVVQDGYEFFAGRKLVTIFSAPHYCGQFNNVAAMMVVYANMRCSFETLRPHTKKQPIKASPTRRAIPTGTSLE